MGYLWNILFKNLTNPVFGVILYGKNLTLKDIFTNRYFCNELKYGVNKK